MMSVAQVEREVREQSADQSAEQLKHALAGMGFDTSGMTREQMVSKLVDLEVYCFTH